MLSATSHLPPVNVSAFIMMHGGVNPVKQYENGYFLSATELPPNTQLLAPSILGNSYYDHQESDMFIHQIHEEYIKNPQIEYIIYSLDKISEYERMDVARFETATTISGAKPDQDKRERAKRLEFLETIVHKSRVTWKIHHHFITQKTYSIYANDNPKNSIMFFCREDLTSVVSSDAFKERFNTSFTTHSRSIMTRMTGDIHYVVGYNTVSRICSIQFVNISNVNLIHFLTIHEILSNVVSYVLQGREFYLSMFDFTCSELTFLGDYDPARGNLKPVFISSNKSDRTLVYGTIDKERVKEMQLTERGRLPWAHSGSPSPQPRLMRSFSAPVVGAAAADTPSPARHTPTLLVHLLPHVETFADFESKYEGRSRSVSPIIHDSGGSRRRRRIRLRHPRVGKKVSRKRNTRGKRNGRFRAKGSIRRTQRKKK